MSDCIRCPKCNGDGFVPLAKPLAETLNILRTCGGQMTVDVLTLHHENGNADLKLTTLMRRLDTLRVMGLVKRSGRGVHSDHYRWEAVKV